MYDCTNHNKKFWSNHVINPDKIMSGNFESKAKLSKVN